MSTRRILLARWLYGWSALPVFFLLWGIPIPAHGVEAENLVVYSTLLAGFILMAARGSRWYGRLRPVSGVLGLIAVYQCAGVVWSVYGHAAQLGPAIVMAMVIVVSYSAPSIIAMLLLARAPAAKAEAAAG